MNKKFYTSLAIVLFFFAATGFLLAHQPSRNNIAEDIQPIHSVRLAGQTIKVALALTSAEQEKGLSGRKQLQDAEGMLFVFDMPGKYPFWMKDMNFSIDMIWIGKDMKVVYIKKDARPESYPETFGPGTADGEATYVLEVAGGFSDKNNLKVGDTVLFIKS